MYIKSTTELNTSSSWNATVNNTSSWNTTVLSKITNKYQELEIFFSVILLSAGLIINTGLILLFVRRRKNYLLANLAVSNYFGIIVLALNIITNLSQKPASNGEHHCNVLLSITEFWWISQNFTLLAISYERYKLIADARPCGNDNICRTRYTYVIFVWLASIAAVLITVKTSWITLKYDDKIFRCRKNWETHPAYMLLYLFVSFWVPGFLLIYFHGYMCYKGYKAKQCDLLRPYSTTLTRSRSLGSIASLREFMVTAIQMPIRRSESLPTGLEDVPNRHDSVYSTGTLSIRKKSITQTAKPIFSTLLILIPYLLTAGPEVILVYFYSEVFNPSHDLDMLVKAKYLIIAYFPFVLCWRDKDVRREVKLLTNKLICCRSARINPGNIEPSDYTDNIIRRDSRRNSLASRQSFSAQEELGSFIPPLMKEGRSKSSPQVKTKGPSTSRDPMQIIHFSTPVNMPAVEVTDLE